MWKSKGLNALCSTLEAKYKGVNEVTIDELIQRLKDTNLPGNTLVYIADDDDRFFIETDEVVKTQVGTLENPRTVVTIY